MKRLDSADSFAALMSICPTSTTSDEHSPRNNSHVYARDLQSILDGLDEEGCLEESVHVAEKKRRLSIDQVKALEKNFEVENKLEPERKVKLAQELGLQPRQVAVWFQNRRARWKTKQLERDYGVLRANYESLKQNYDVIHHDNKALLKEIGELKTKLNQENTESNTVSVKEEINSPEGDDKAVVGSLQIHASETKDDVNYRRCLDNKNSNSISKSKDGSSVDSDSSAVLNDDNSLNPAISSSGVPNQDDLVSSPPPTSSLKFNSTITSSSSPSSASVSCIKFVKMEENSFFISSEEEACNFFSDEEAPTLQWYQWN